GRRSTGSRRINEGASTSKGVSASYEALEREIAELSQVPSPRWIECVKCKKWRLSEQYFEAKEIPDEWECKMWITKDRLKGSCDMPGSTDEPCIEDEPFPEGEIVLAKLRSYDYWPGMIESDPGDMFSSRITHKGSKQYNVTFFGQHPSRQWVFKSNIKKYIKSDPQKVQGKRLKQAIAEGNEAIDTPFSIRIKKYSLVTLRGKKNTKTTVFAGRSENKDASVADGEKEPSTDDQEASPNNIFSFDLRANGMQTQLLSPADDRQASSNSISGFKHLANELQPRFIHQELSLSIDDQQASKLEILMGSKHNQ
ncbi:unnamed protein product, partial [Larinioides sclopetarius]